MHWARGEPASRTANRSQPARGSGAHPHCCRARNAQKRRHCKFDVVPGKRYCGNHLYLAGGEGPKRVPCPWDPKGGHTVRSRCGRRRAAGWWPLLAAALLPRAGLG